MLILCQKELRQLSRQSAPDLDGWISQAKQLQKDIEHSKATAHEIVQEAEAGKTLQAHVHDASSKVGLLKRELDYNVTLADVAEQLQITAGLLDTTQHLTSQNELLEALSKLGEANAVISQLDAFDNARFAGLIQRRAAQIKELLVAKILECWSSLVITRSSTRQVIVHAQLQSKASSALHIYVHTDPFQKTTYP
jgi:centromere/kinetochore protein ZW10